jgi:hypothetical protein
MTDSQFDKLARAKAAAAVKAERKARAGLSRTIKLRLYPTAEQAKRINGTIGAIRHVWNALWLPMLNAAAQARRDYAKAHGDDDETWKAAWRLNPDPSETAYNRARMAAQAPGAEREWIAEALQSPLTRARHRSAAASSVASLSCPTRLALRPSSTCRCSVPSPTKTSDVNCVPTSAPAA